MTQTAYLSLGSNIGDSLQFLQAAVDTLNAHEDIQVTAISPVYQTAAWGKVDQEDFLNICCQVETSLDAEPLLDFCQAIEKNLKRVRHEHWGPRTIDIDIILYGDEAIETPRLTVPHAFMWGRAFVLQPLADIVPDLKPVGQHQTVAERLLALSEQEVVKTQLKIKG